MRAQRFHSLVWATPQSHIVHLHSPHLNLLPPSRNCSPPQHTNHKPPPRPHRHLPAQPPFLRRHASHRHLRQRLRNLQLAEHVPAVDLEPAEAQHHGAVRPDLRHGVLGRVPGHGGGAEGGDEGGDEVHDVGGADVEDGGGGIEAGWEGVGEGVGKGEVVRLEG